MRGGRLRGRDRVTLQQIAAQLHQHPHGPGVLDTLPDDTQPQPVAELQDRAHDRDVGQAAVGVGDEPLVDLHFVERQGLEDLHRAVAGAEVVQRQLDPAGAQLPEHGGGPRRLRDQRALSDLKGQDVGGQSVPGQRLRHQVGQVVTDEHARREVHRHRDVFAGAGPVRALAQGLVQHPLGEVDDQGRPFRHRQERAGRQQPPARMPPAQQRLHPGDPASLAGQQRLVVQHQLAAGDRGA